MPLVFVHGVNVRQGETPEKKAKFEKSVADRDELFRTIGLAGLVVPGGRLHIENPYWGDHAAKFSYDLVSVPGPGTETFGSADDAMAQVVTETIPFDVAIKAQQNRGEENALLLTLARSHSLSHALDAIVVAATMHGVEGDANDLATESYELAAFAARAAVYTTSNPDTSWLNGIDPRTQEPRLQSNSDFLEALVRHVKAASNVAPVTEEFGMNQVLNRLKIAAQALNDAGERTLGAIVGAAAGGTLGAAIGGAPRETVRVLRPTATRRAGIFFGDVFAYLAKRQPIVEIIIAALDAATAQSTAQDKHLIVVAHSMGGNIVYDILTHYRPNIHIDLLVTVGSQVALFKELRLYCEDEKTPPHVQPPARVQKPAAVGSWLNIVDPLDVLSFAAEGVFEEVKDFAYSNQASPLNTHSLYFVRPTFHQRLSARIAELDFGTTL